jgi:hypothetical protein
MTRDQIKAICTAYELGIGAGAGGIKASGNPYAKGSDEATAWGLGRQSGLQLAQCCPAGQLDQATASGGISAHQSNDSVMA